MSLLNRIERLREENGNISINRLEKEAGLTRGSMSKWDDHTPSYEKLKKVADYFGFSVSELTGEQKETPALQSENGESIGPAKQALLDAVDDMSEEEISALIELAKAAKKMRR